ncbi:MAG: hypothetical protein ACJ70X_00280, partial [Nitrososphaera sp.]
AYVYLFDCFEKSDDQNQNQRLYAEIVADLFNLTGVLPREYEPARNQLNVDEMTMAAEETMSVWELMIYKRCCKTLNGYRMNPL